MGLICTTTNKNIIPALNMYAGGYFTSPASHIAKWSGTSWSAMSSGLVDTVRGITVGPNGYVYACGDFAARASVFNGSSWSTLGSGLGNTTYAITVHPSTGYVYAGGAFTSPGNHIAVWNGSSWSAMGSLNGEVRSILIKSNGDIYACGMFYNSGGNLPSYVAKWDGSSWVKIGNGPTNGLDGPGYSLAVRNSTGHVYVGGNFVTAGGNQADHVAVWDGYNWGPLGLGPNGNVFSLAINQSNGYVYACGSFTTASGYSASNVAMWNGSIWSPMGSGVDGVAYGIAVDSNTGYVYVAGNFTGYVKKWDGTSWTNAGTVNHIAYSIAVG